MKMTIELDGITTKLTDPRRAERSSGNETMNEPTTFERATRGADSVQRVLGCPNCKSTNIIKLWRAEIVLPGDNSDNSTKGYRYGCKDCEQTFYSNLNTDSV